MSAVPVRSAILGAPAQRSFYCADCQLTHLRAMKKVCEAIATRDTLVVFVDGSCKNNRHPRLPPQAGVGVYFGPCSQYNFSRRVPVSEPQSSTCAEVYAAFAATVFIRGKYQLGNQSSIKKVLLVTASDHLVQVMSNRSFGERPESGLLRGLEARITAMAKDGLEVEFCLISRNENKEADKLARASVKDA
ncbi:hypothetical protein SAICODRAFT_25402 [Saitoella complicata NRRL Y-17804]|uniref:uncharacterized protein n=1 Tax=Saitoella complicata (strain BCRC 22490 / CBS 7301 / JCM 7358 / NBRC 10748 / NRRL Y-17804) TaxID=698492 RepID=UPI000866BC9F|nr:uncharacterized protein SAICODRAFT_25402 [Saitoella complicata NRRL Y-17804]ODQ52869.1 hypothetical protein SAICODRAFT_25402 [Saitoella complicata NRRL Y-17804]